MKDQAQKMKDLQTEVASLRHDLQLKKEQLIRQQKQKPITMAQNRTLFPVNPSDVYALCYKCSFLGQEVDEVFEELDLDI